MLTYFDVYPSCRSCTFGDEDGVGVGGIGDEGEDLAGEVDGRAIFVLGFQGFTVGLV